MNPRLKSKTVAWEVAIGLLSIASLASSVLHSGFQKESDKQQTTAPAQANQAPAAAPSAGCLVVKHKGTVGRRLLFTALIGVPIAPGAKYDLVDSVNYKPEKVAFKGKELQALQKQGVRVVILEKNYTQDNLESARKSCHEAK